MRQVTNIELIDKALNDDKKAFSILVDRHYTFCINKASRIVNDHDLAKDLVQEGLMEAYFNLCKLSDKHAFKPWLGSIIHNVCNNYIRKNSKKYASLKHYFDEQQSIESNAEGKIVELVLQAVKTLDVSFEAIVYAFYYEGKTISEICHEQSITPALAKVRLHRARIELKAILLEKPEMKEYKQYFKSKKTMKEVKIIDLIPSSNDLKAWVITLLEEESNLIIPIVITTELAATLAAGIKGIVLPRPLTHNLLADVLSTNGIQPESVYINDIENGVYLSVLKAKSQNVAHEYDARPSDAINIAVRFGCPIFVSQAVLKKAGIQIPEKFGNQPSLKKGIGQLLQYIENEQLKIQERFNSAKNKSAIDLQEQADKLMSFVFEE